MYVKNTVQPDHNSFLVHKLPEAAAVDLTTDDVTSRAKQTYLTGTEQCIQNLKTTLTSM